MTAVKTCFSKYADFSGRARRSELWWYALFVFLVSVVLSFVDAALFGATILGGLWSLATLLPSLAVGARRLHDTGRSGWWLVIAFVPLIGVLVLIYFYILDSEPGANAYGPNPKGA